MEMELEPLTTSSKKNQTQSSIDNSKSGTSGRNRFLTYLLVLVLVASCFIYIGYNAVETQEETEATSDIIQKHQNRSSALPIPKTPTTTSTTKDNYANSTTGAPTISKPQQAIATNSPTKSSTISTPSPIQVPTTHKVTTPKPIDAKTTSSPTQSKTPMPTQEEKTIPATESPTQSRDNENINSVQESKSVIPSPGTGGGKASLKIKFDVSELCQSARNITDQYSSKFFECGQYRLMSEFGQSVVLDTIEVNPITGMTSITATLCQPDCFDWFNSSDLSIWIRIKSSDVVFATLARPVDCRTWRSEIQLPVTSSSSSSSSSDTKNQYHVDVMLLWLFGYPKKGHWRSNTERETKANTLWVGERLKLINPKIHSKTGSENRWMSCEDWCIMNHECTHWSENPKIKPRFTTSNTNRCRLFTKVNGTVTEPDFVSGDFPPHIRRVTYLGGLSIDSHKKVEDRQRCRQMAHVLGSPTPLDLPPSTNSQNKNKKKNNGGTTQNSIGDLSSLSKLPFCKRGDIGRKTKEVEQEGFWASSTAVYPLSKITVENCPEACYKDVHPDKCKPEDSLQGVCAFNDVWVHRGDPKGRSEIEPPLKDFAWVERDCRYRIGTGEMFQQCLKDKKFDLLLAPKNVFSGELYDRWQFQNNHDWGKLGMRWAEGKNYLQGLKNQWQNITKNKAEDNPLKVVVAQYHWGGMRDRLYQKHRFDAADWESAIAGSLNGWKQAIEDGWVSKESIFIVILVSSAHEFFGDPFYTNGAVDFFNEITKKKYLAAGWHVVDEMAMSRARPDHGTPGGAYNYGFGPCPESKCSGNSVHFTVANVMYNTVCG